MPSSSNFDPYTYILAIRDAVAMMEEKKTIAWFRKQLVQMENEHRELLKRMDTIDQNMRLL